LLDRLEPGHQHPPIASFNDAQIVRGRAGLRKMVGGYSTTSTPTVSCAEAKRREQKGEAFLRQLDQPVRPVRLLHRQWRRTC